MQIIKAIKLAKRLREDSVPEQEKLKYFLFSFLGTIFFSTYSKQSPASQSIDIANYSVDITQSLVFLISLAGIIVCFQINKKGDGKNFIERFICLSFPISIQTALVLILIAGIPSIILPSALYITPEEAIQEYGWFTVPFTLFVTLGYMFWRFIICFKYASGLKET